MELKQDDFKLTIDQLIDIDQKFSALSSANPMVVIHLHHVLCVAFGFSFLGSPISSNIQMLFDDDQARYSDVRPFAHTDISLSEDHLRAINFHFNEGLRALNVREGLYNCVSSNITHESLYFWVKFKFGPGWRSLEAGFEDFDEMESNCIEFPIESWSNSSAISLPS
jgi:hypothetical protein